MYIDGKKIRLYSDGQRVFTEFNQDYRELERIMQQYTYGIKIQRIGNWVYFEPTPHSGIKTEYRDYFANILADSQFDPKYAYHNQIAIIALLIAAGVSIAIIYFYRNQIGAMITQAITPLFMLGGMMMMGVIIAKLIRR